MAGETPPPQQGGVVRGASLLIVLQVASRALTFIANQLLLRFLTAQLLGVSTQLEVYYLSVLFFARESLRVAIQRQAGSGNNAAPEAGEKASTSSISRTTTSRRASRASRARSAQAIVNIAHLSIALGVAASLLLGATYHASLSPATRAVPHLRRSLVLYGLAAWLELLSEPAFAVLQARLRLGPRAAAEGLGALARCALTLGAAFLAARSGRDVGVLPFALGQLGYGTALLAVYLWRGTALQRDEGFSLWPRRVVGAGKGAKRDDDDDDDDDDAAEYVLGFFYRPTLDLAGSMMAQSVVKHVLTQGDTFLVSVLSTPTAQGTYALANNYGGLVARLVFQPVEESSRSYFSRLLAPSTIPLPESESESDTNAEEKNPGGPDHPTPNSSSSNKVPQPPSLAALRTASESLTSLLRPYLVLSLPVLALGPAAAPPLLCLVAGPRWAATPAGATLAAYCYYIPLLALNGLLEAFVASVATEAQVHAQSLWMALFSAVFGMAGLVALRLLDLGARGLVLANAVNMTCRIVWAAWFVRGYFARLGAEGVDLDRVRPGATSVGAAVVAASVVRQFAGGGGAHDGARQALVELAKVAGVAIPFLGVLAFTERRFLTQCYRTIRGRRGG